MKKRLILLLALVLALTMLFTACGPKGGNEPSGGDEPAKTTAAPAGDDKTTPKAEKPADTTTKAAVDATTTPAAEKPDDGKKAAYLTMTQEEALKIKAGENKEPSGQVVIGDISQTTGDFSAGWTNASPDAALKKLIHEGLDTVYFDEKAVMHVNPVVVKSFEVSDDAEGNRTFTIGIYDNLKFSDGSPVTADDYLFSTLMRNSWEFGSGAIGGFNSGGYQVVGYDEYHAVPKSAEEKEKAIKEENAKIEEENDKLRKANPGKKDAEIEGIKELLPMPTDLEYEKRVFKGLRKLDDHKWSVTISAKYLPYYYELSMASFGPEAHKVIAPGVEVKDDGEGCYLTDAYTVALLKEKILDKENGYRYKPTVTAGPYVLKNYDPETKLRTLEVNPHYIGTFNGKKPAIKTIVQKTVSDDTQMEELKTYQVDLLSPINGKASIEGGLAVVDADKDHLDFVTFNRNGYGYLGFHCDTSPTQYKEVRQAIAHLLDRDAFMEQYAGPYAAKVNGMYGLGQLEYQFKSAEIQEKLNPYNNNPEKAVELLEKCGFTLDKEGKPYSGQGVRYKEVTDEKELPAKGNAYDKMMVEVDGKKLMPLEINWINTPKNPVSELIRTLLLPEAEKVGMKINDNTQDFNILLKHFYRDGVEPADIEYTMLNLATGFAKVLGFWDDMNPSDDYMGFPNASFIKDDDNDLYKLTLKMYECDSQKPEDWYDRWMDFQVAWNDYLPQLPLYSDIYHVFYNKKIKNFDQDVLWDYADAIVYAEVAE